MSRRTCGPGTFFERSWAVLELKQLPVTYRQKGSSELEGLTSCRISRRCLVASWYMKRPANAANPSHRRYRTLVKSLPGKNIGYFHSMMGNLLVQWPVLLGNVAFQARLPYKLLDNLGFGLHLGEKCHAPGDEGRDLRHLVKKCPPLR